MAKLCSVYSAVSASRNQDRVGFIADVKAGAWATGSALTQYTNALLGEEEIEKQKEEIPHVKWGPWKIYAKNPNT